MRLRMLLSTLLLLAAAPNVPCAQSNKAADLSELDDVVRRHLQKAGKHIIAFSAVGVRDGDIVWQFVSGMADHNKSEAVTPDTRFMW
eukprot:SAG31_NODE_15093_length_771_cov_1.205357_1_plen_86_part_10